MTIVDRKTRCILGWKVVWEGTKEAIQLMVDDAKRQNGILATVLRLITA